MDRGEADGVGKLYSGMEKRGELWTYPGRVVPVGPVLERLRCSFRF